MVKANRARECVLHIKIKFAANCSTLSFGLTTFIRVNLNINHETVEFIAIYRSPSLPENDFSNVLSRTFANNDGINKRYRSVTGE